MARREEKRRKDRSLFLDGAGSDARQDIALEENVDEDGGQHDDDDAGRHGGELAVVGVYEVGQLQGSGADIVFQGGDYAVLEGVDGFHRRLPDQVAHDAERPYKHHQQRDDDHDGEITKIKPLEHRLLFLAGHMRSTSPLV